MGELETTAAASTPARATPEPALVTMTHLIYGLHAFSVLIGLTSAATVVGAFVFGLPSIVAVVLNYVKRGEARGTMLESHFRWQIRTFWYAALWVLVALALLLTIIGIPLAIAVFCGAGIWVIYRVARGWLALNDRRPMYAASGGRA
jgi:uncharacterized membrane protein